MNRFKVFLNNIHEDESGENSPQYWEGGLENYFKIDFRKLQSGLNVLSVVCSNQKLYCYTPIIVHFILYSMTWVFCYVSQRIMGQNLDP